MRFSPSEPDIATVFNRIVDGDYDLQPDFQRGEVWSKLKQQRLIDSILRGWVIPPILLIAGRGSDPQQVLDGQQRLAAIRDFKLNRISVNGTIEPLAERITSLNGLRYSELPPDISKSFDKFTLRFYEITDFRPEEPAEIFFRLNQPTSLTSAEKRNAFFGPVRDEIRALVESLQESPQVLAVLGFGNSRMAYDDVLARMACTLEYGSLRRKVTEASIASMYRWDRELSSSTSSRINTSLGIFKAILSDPFPVTSQNLRLNKATMFSWLLFFSRLNATGDLDRVAEFFRFFESTRRGLSHNGDDDHLESFTVQREGESIAGLFQIYSDRATSRVADVSSVLLRDFIKWLVWYQFTGGRSAGCFDEAYIRLDEMGRTLHRSKTDEVEDVALKLIDEWKWGERI